MTRSSLFLATGLFAILLSSLWLAHAFSGTEQPMPQFGISLTTDRATYASQEEPIAIAMTLTIANRTGEPVEFNFTSAQRYDFAIADEQGDEVWRWSAERMFAQMLGTEALGPGEELVYGEVGEVSLEPGSYTVTGTLTATDRPMSATLTVKVK